MTGKIAAAFLAAAAPVLPPGGAPCSGEPSLAELLAEARSVAQPPALGERDWIRLESGRVLSGRIVLEREDAVALLTGTRERWVPRAEIESLESVARSHRAILARFRGLSRETPEALLELADACEEASLVHERELFLWRILVLDPQHDQANEALGHRRSPRGWLVPVGRGWRSLANAERARGEWREAWELRSEHWLLRSNAGLARALDTLFELEFLYDAFYALFQDELELRELTEPIGAHVYSSQDQLPPISNNIGAWFDGGENRLMTFFAVGRPYALFHEATHGVLHNVAVRAAGSRGNLPAWLDEAWAEYMEGVLAPVGGGRVQLVPGGRKARLARVLGAQEKPYGLHRVLNFGGSDFGASSRQDQKYAQCYALFLYMLEGEGGRHRAAFMDYLREALAGKGQASTFRRIFRRDLDAIEEGHLLVR